MRAAKEARDARQPFSASDVTEPMRGDTVTVVAVGRRPVPTGFDAPEVSPPIAMGIRLRGLGTRPAMLEPLGTSRLRFRPGPAEALFDLSAVRALGPEIEVIINSAGDARCRLNARALAEVR